MNTAQILAVLKERLNIDDPEQMFMKIELSNPGGYSIKAYLVLTTKKISVSLYDLEKYVNIDINHNLEIGEKKTDADFVIENFTWMLQDQIKDLF